MRERRIGGAPGEGVCMGVEMSGREMFKDEGVTERERG